MHRLPARLESLLEGLEGLELLVDVGCDHGRVALAAAERALAKRVVGLDLRAEPLAGAARRLAAARRRGGEGEPAGRLALVRGAGLEAISAPAGSALILAGLGPRSMIDVLKKTGSHLGGFAAYRLQPNGEAAGLRAALVELGLELVDERLVMDAGRCHLVLSAQPGEGERPYEGLEGETRELALLVGPLLMRRRELALLALARRLLRDARRALGELEAARGAAAVERGRIARRARALEELLAGE